jgi:hypothetical protein
MPATSIAQRTTLPNPYRKMHTGTLSLEQALRVFSAWANGFNQLFKMLVQSHLHISLL